MKKSLIHKPFLAKFGKFKPTIKTNNLKDLPNLIKIGQ